MFGSHGSRFIRTLLTAGGITLSTGAFAETQRGEPCLFDEDCSAGSFCGDEARCVAPLTVGELCDRHAMCDSGLCLNEACGVLTIDSPIDGIATREPKLVVRGQAPIGTRLELACGPHLERVVADDTGAWLWVPGVALGDGQHTITARAGLAEVSTTIDVDTTRPALQVFSPAPDQVTAREDLEIRGRVEAGTTFAVRIDGVDTFVSLDPHGDWTYRGRFAHGRHRVEASAVDAVGNRSTLDFTFDVDLEAPGVAVTWPASGSVFASVPERLSGLAEPGTALRIEGHGAGVWLTVGAGGTWSWLLPSLTDGTYTYLVTAHDRSGWTSSESVTLTIDRTPPGVAVNAPGDGARVASQRPIFRGMADEGTDVRVLVDGEAIGAHTYTGADGRWSVWPSRDLAEGEHVVVVVATDRAGNETHSESSLTVDLTAPTLSVIAEPRVGDAPIRIAGRTEPRASIEVRVDGLLAASAIADRMGDWSVELALTEGEHTVTVLARDEVGYTTEGSVLIPDADADLVGAGSGCAGGGLGGSAALLAAALALLALRRRATVAR